MSEGMTREQAITYFQNRTAFVDGKEKQACEIAILAIAALSAEPMRWIPITYRKMTDEEKKDYAERTGYDEKDLDVMLDCPMPEDGEMVLITDRLGNVETDVYFDDFDGGYFECNEDMDDVKAWMPFPKPYSEKESE